jgi:SAM-dependent methyltransferase
MSKLQEILTKTMYQAGEIVEKIAGLTSKSQKKPVKPKKTGVTDEEGQDFATVHWDERHIHALLSGAERTQLYPLIPNLAGKATLHLTPSKTDYLFMMKKRGADNIVELDVTKSSVATEVPEAKDHPFARGAVDKLPFTEKYFDFVIYPSALAWRADLPNLVPEMARVLKENGRFLISTVHPFFEYLMNPRGGFRKSIGTLFHDLKRNGFFIDELREATLEETLRVVSLPNKINDELRRFPGMPIVLLMRGILLKKRTAK